jgi:hypothetical protein
MDSNNGLVEEMEKTNLIIQEELIRNNGTKFNAYRNQINKKIWRLVYSKGKVKDLFESEGYTWTINDLFCGTKKECLDKIKELKLEEGKEIDGEISYINL